MAKVNFNLPSLEYAFNTLDFWNYDDANNLVEFSPNTNFYIERIGDPSTVYTGNVVSNSGGHIQITINPPKGDGITGLHRSTDNIYDTNNPGDHKHIYALRDPNTNVYLAGTVQLVEVAGP